MFGRKIIITIMMCLAILLPTVIAQDNLEGDDVSEIYLDTSEQYFPSNQSFMTPQCYISGGVANDNISNCFDGSMNYFEYNTTYNIQIDFFEITNLAMLRIYSEETYYITISITTQFNYLPNIIKILDPNDYLQIEFPNIPTSEIKIQFQSYVVEGYYVPGHINEVEVYYEPPIAMEQVPIEYTNVTYENTTYTNVTYQNEILQIYNITYENKTYQNETATGALYENETFVTYENATYINSTNQTGETIVYNHYYFTNTSIPDQQSDNKSINQTISKIQKGYTLPELIILTLILIGYISGCLFISNRIHSKYKKRYEPTNKTIDPAIEHISNNGFTPLDYEVIRGTLKMPETKTKPRKQLGTGKLQ